MATHEVFNVPPPWTGANLITGDAALRTYIGEETAESLSVLGGLAGSHWAQDMARLANANPPVLHTHDRYGHRIDEVEFHPAWHELMAVAVQHGLHGTPWAALPDTGAHLTRAAGFYSWSQNEAGHGCPISMTYAAVPALRRSPALATMYEPGLVATEYEFGLRTPDDKMGLIAGMGMTEKQGGSDVRANTTQAKARLDGSYLLTGHKWFCSAPMSDVFLVLAQTEEGLSCFLVPRVLPDGSRNTFLLQRLKDKLGNRSNASSEVEFDNTVGWLVGDAGRGLNAILEMVTMTRLDCVIGSAATQRAALTQAIHYATYRSAFGKPLIEQPAMQQVLADLALESEAATALFVRLAQGVDRGESAFLRIAVAASKYWVCKRTPPAVAEALECLGGNGYVEDSGMPRLFKDSPLNSIWEGSGNVIALDVVRALTRDAASRAAVEAELATTAGMDERLDAGVQRFRSLADRGASERARELAGLLARCLQASLLLRRSPQSVAHAFLASRFAPGTSGPSAVFGEYRADPGLIERAAVESNPHNGR
jgi:putative acyl-CoA dehydrogenase